MAALVCAAALVALGLHVLNCLAHIHPLLSRFELELGVRNNVYQVCALGADVSKPLVALHVACERIFVARMFNVTQNKAQLGAELVELAFLHGGRLDNVDFVVWYQLEQLLVVFCQHVSQAQGSIPRLGAKVDHKRNDGKKLILFAKAR